jgi:hypothetical protein
MLNIEKNKCAEGSESKTGCREFLASSSNHIHTHIHSITIDNFSLLLETKDDDHHHQDDDDENSV